MSPQLAAQIEFTEEMLAALALADKMAMTARALHLQVLLNAPERDQ